MSRQPGLKMDMGTSVFWSPVIDRLGKIQDFTERGEIRTAEWGPVWVGSKVSLSGKGFSKNKVLVNGISDILRPSKRYLCLVFFYLAVGLGRCFQIGLEFRSVDFCGGSKTGEPREKPSKQGREPTTNSTQLHWWEANALTTGPSLLPRQSGGSVTEWCRALV